MGTAASTPTSRPKGGRLVKQAPLQRLREGNTAEGQAGHLDRAPGYGGRLTRTNNNFGRVRRSTTVPNAPTHKRYPNPSTGSIKSMRSVDSVGSKGSYGKGAAHSARGPTHRSGDGSGGGSGSKRNLPGITERDKADARRQREHERHEAANTAKARAAEQRRQAKEKGGMTFNVNTRSSPSPVRKSSLTTAATLEPIPAGKRSRGTSPAKRDAAVSAAGGGGIISAKSAKSAGKKRVSIMVGDGGVDGDSPAPSLSLTSSATIPKLSPASPDQPGEWGAVQIDVNGEVSAEVESKEIADLLNVEQLMADKAQLHDLELPSPSAEGPGVHRGPGSATPRRSASFKAPDSHPKTGPSPLSGSGASVAAASTGGDARTVAFVGMAGVRSLLIQVEEGATDLSAGDTLRVVRHASSPASKEKLEEVAAAAGSGAEAMNRLLHGIAGHNSRIDQEKGYEKELADMLNTLGERGVNVEHAMTVSTAFGGAAQTRASSVYIDSSTGEVMLKGLEPPAVARAVAQRLVTKLPRLTDLLRSTSHKATYLHDVKALYLAHALQELSDAKVLVQQTVRLFSDGCGPADPGVRPDLCCLVPSAADDNGAGPAVDTTDAASDAITKAGFTATEYRCMLVPAEQTVEFDRMFWSWFRDVLDGVGQPEYTPLHGITCDLGYGYPTAVPGKNPFAAQDADDEIALDVHMLHVTRQLKMVSRPTSASPRPRSTGGGSQGSRPPSARMRVAPPLLIQVADETPMYTRWIRLEKWARAQRSIAGCPAFTVRQQPFKIGDANAGMFDELFATIEAAGDGVRTAAFTAACRWLDQRCHFAAICWTDRPGHLDVQALDGLCRILQQLSECKTVEQVLSTMIEQTAPFMSVAALQQEVRTRSTHVPTLAEIEHVLACASEVTEAGKSGGPGGLPPTSWSTVPEKLAAMLNLCPADRKASKCVLAVKILETRWQMATSKQAKRELSLTIPPHVQAERGESDAADRRGTVHSIGTGDDSTRLGAAVVLEKPYQDGSVIVGFVADKYCPFTKSLAANGVCFAGDSRYNPFFGSLEATVGLMKLYLDFCTENKRNLLGYTLSEMKAHIAANTADGLLSDDAPKVAAVLTRLKEAEEADETKAYISFRSTCQTWSAVRGSNGFPEANFSCLVPHFQNAITLSDAAIATLDDDSAAAYARCLINYMHTTKPYLKKFVDVDAFVSMYSDTDP